MYLKGIVEGIEYELNILCESLKELKNGKEKIQFFLNENCCYRPQSYTMRVQCILPVSSHEGLISHGDIDLI